MVGDGINDAPVSTNYENNQALDVIDSYAGPRRC